VIADAAKTIEDIVSQVKVSNVVLYAFIHLFPESLPLAEFAMGTIQQFEDMLKKNFNVHRVPFGWYKMHGYIDNCEKWQN